MRFTSKRVSDSTVIPPIFSTCSYLEANILFYSIVSLVDVLLCLECSACCCCQSPSEEIKDNLNNMRVSF
jgi:hypothetical protein